MRVAFFLPNVGSYLDRARTLAEASHGIERLYLLVGRLDTALDLAEHPKCTLVRTGFRAGRRWSNQRRACAIAQRLVREEGVEVLHDTFGHLLPLLRRRPRRHGLWCAESLYCLNAWRLAHVWAHAAWPRRWLTRDGLGMQYGARVERAVCRHANRVVLQAPGLVPRLQETTAISAERLSVIPNSVDTGFWHLTAGVAKREAPRKPVRLLFVGAVGRSRGSHTLVEALRLLRAQGEDATCTLVGRVARDEEAQLRARIRTCHLDEAMHLAGALGREGVREAMQRHDLFVYHTINDASPRTVLEAMASELPVVASRHPGIDVLDPEGEAIRFTVYGDAAGTARAVRSFREEPDAWRARAERGRAIARERHSLAAVAREYVRFWRAGP